MRYVVCDLRAIGVSRRASVRHVEWHFTFQHPSRLDHLVELDRRAFSLAWIESFRSISDAVDGVKQLLVEGVAEKNACGWSAVAL